MYVYGTRRFRVPNVAVDTQKLLYILIVDL